jgi:UPF0755 protein
MSAKKFFLGLLDAAVKIAFVVVVVMLISKYSKMAYDYGYHIFNQSAVSSGSGRSVTFTVKSGDSVDTIADNMAGVGLITDKRLFKIQERFSEYHGMEQPGTYELSTAMTPEEMLAIIAGGAAEGAEDGESEEKSEYEDEMPEILEPGFDEEDVDGGMGAGEEAEGD